MAMQQRVICREHRGECPHPCPFVILAADFLTTFGLEPDNWCTYSARRTGNGMVLSVYRGDSPVGSFAPTVMLVHHPTELPAGVFRLVMPLPDVGGSPRPKVDRSRMLRTDPEADIAAIAAAAVSAWTQPEDTSLRARNSRMGAALSVYPHAAGTCAQGLYAVGRHTIRHMTPDGRYTFGGVTEPCPGLWPRSAVELAAEGDLTALWPYLA